MANAERVMEQNRQLAARMNGYHCMSKCFDLASSGTRLPEVQYMHCDKRKCEVIPGRREGLGMGRQAIA